MPGKSTLVYDPYLASLGGGEKYAFALALAASAAGPVTIASPSAPSSATLRHSGFPDLPITRVPAWRYHSLARRHDRVIRVANHLPPASPMPGRSWLIVQFPFSTFAPRHPARAALRRRQLAGYRCVVYSDFVRRHLQLRWGADAAVLAPPVEQGQYSPIDKECLILSVGRFFPGEHTKRHDVLIDAHRSLPPETAARWPLVLAGGVDSSPSAQAYLASLRSRIGTANIQIMVNASATTLASLYRRASLFWHATGYGRSPKSPEKAEHFGISTIEAMSWGAVPMAYQDGGIVETVSPGQGVLWRTASQLTDATLALTADLGRRQRMAQTASVTARQWRPERFTTLAQELLSS